MTRTGFDHFQLIAERTEVRERWLAAFFIAVVRPVIDASLAELDLKVPTDQRALSLSLFLSLSISLSLSLSLGM